MAPSNCAHWAFSTVTRSRKCSARYGGRQITVATLDQDALGPVPADMRTMCEHYNHRGLLGSPLVLRAILGREPRTLRAYFEELARISRCSIQSSAGSKMNTHLPS